MRAGFSAVNARHSSAVGRGLNTTKEKIVQELSSSFRSLLNNIVADLKDKMSTVAVLTPH